MEIQKFEYHENEKGFLDEMKSIFHSFWRAIIWWKNKNLMKIVDTSFKEMASPFSCYPMNCECSQKKTLTEFFFFFSVFCYNL